MKRYLLFFLPAMISRMPQEDYVQIRTNPVHDHTRKLIHQDRFWCGRAVQIRIGSGSVDKGEEGCCVCRTKKAYGIISTSGRFFYTPGTVPQIFFPASALRPE